MGIGAPHDNARAGAAWVFTGSPEVTPPPPTVTNVMPGAGEAGITVKVRGTNLTGAEAVFFDGKPTTFVVKSALVIEAVVPEGPTGTVDVTVQTPEGVSVLNRPGDEFRYTTGKAKGGGTENENPNPPPGGPGTGPGNEGTGSQTTTGGSKGASGGVLGTTSSAGAACVLTLRNKHSGGDGLSHGGAAPGAHGRGGVQRQADIELQQEQARQAREAADDRHGLVLARLSEQQSAEDRPEQGGPEAVPQPRAPAERDPLVRALGPVATACAQRERAPDVEESAQAAHPDEVARASRPGQTRPDQTRPG